MSVVTVVVVMSLTRRLDLRLATHFNTRLGRVAVWVLVVAFVCRAQLLIVAAMPVLT